MTEERRESEVERRELARKHRGEVVADSGSPIEPRRMPVMVSVRLEAELVGELRRIATERGASMSEVLRDSVRLYVRATRSATQAVSLNWDLIRISPTGEARTWITGFSSGRVHLSELEATG